MANNTSFSDNMTDLSQWLDSTLEALRDGDITTGDLVAEMTKLNDELFNAVQEARGIEAALDWMADEIKEHQENTEALEAENEWLMDEVEQHQERNILWSKGWDNDVHPDDMEDWEVAYYTQGA